jgi:transcriptional regulator with XRE-family HTH domain
MYKEVINMDTFAHRLKYLRNEYNLTGEELGQILNVTKVAISKWETGHRTPDVDMLVKIADYFDVTLDFLLGRTDDRDTIIVKDKVDGHDIEIGIDRKGYPNGLTHDEVVEVFRQLESIGFDVSKLIKNVKKEE